MKTFKPFALMSAVLLVGVLVLAACGATPPTPATPAGTATVETGAGSEAAQRAVDALAQTLNVDPLDIAVIRTEPVQWPDTCLGINLRDLMCAMHIVPGYRVVLEVHDQQYVYHANEDGSSLVAVPFMTLTWEVGGQCQTADLNYEQGITYGPCNGTTTTAPFTDSSQLLDLAGFSAKFAPFSAETSVGNLTFFGMGTQAITPVEQRMMAEWARVAAEEAAGAEVGTAQGVAITWHREGGVAGFCDDLVVYVTGKVIATSCEGAQPQELGQYFLDPEQLQQLYGWTDTLKPFEMEQTDNATADALTIRLVFYGNGTQEASAADQQAIEGFAADLFLQISQEQAAPGAVGTPVVTGDPGQTVSEFLTSLQNDASGNSSLSYLGPDLQAYVQNGHPVPTLLGTEGTFRSFGISETEVEADGKYALVEVGLNFVSPVRRAFELVQEKGQWLINALISYSIPSTNVTAGTATADRVILDYVHALQDQNPAAAWALLSPDTQSATSQADISAELQSIQAIAAVSLDLTQAAQEQLVYTVVLWVAPAQGESSVWRAGANPQTFDVVHTAQGWRIDKISDVLGQSGLFGPVGHFG